MNSSILVDTNNFQMFTFIRFAEYTYIIQMFAHNSLFIFLGV